MKIKIMIKAIYNSKIKKKGTPKWLAREKAIYSTDVPFNF